MLGLASLALVPAPLLLFIANAPAPALSFETQWPYNLPPHMKYFPEDEALVRRNVGIQKRLASQRPIGVHKMSGDEGEMFFPEYWVFNKAEDTSTKTLKRNRNLGLRSPSPHEERGGLDNWANASMLISLQAPFTLHTTEQIEPKGILQRLHRLPRAIFYRLEERDFQCPGDTLSCTSINRPNSCCPTGESCQLITNVGLGDVGCCAQGQTCSQQVSSCQAGYKSCPGSSGGGCCIPGYDCVGIGCALVSIATVLVNPTVTASPTTSTSGSQLSIITIASTSTSTNLIIIPPISTSQPSRLSSATISSTATSSPPPLTTSATTSSSLPPTTLQCSPGYRSCAPSLGGGCCAIDRSCGPAALCPGPTSASTSTSTSTSTKSASPSTTTTTTNPAFNVPVRPTSGDICPTGFYQCSAYYHGGCCRIGRDCSLTSCPTPASTVVASTNGVVIVAPTGSGIAPAGPALGTGRCAQGWVACAAGNGGGCCPSGYACGQSCTATAAGISATASVEAKIPTSGAGVRSSWGFGWALITAGITLGYGIC